MSYEIAHLTEIEEIDDGRVPWRPVRHRFGITSFGVNSWTANRGDRLINEHDEADENNEELYFVAQGRAVFELDGERRDAPVGTFVFVEPAVKRTAFAEEDGTTVLAIGGVPGKAYEPSGWEFWAPAMPLYNAGEYEQAADRMREIVEANPGYGLLVYNLACCESKAGRTADAIEHLQQALALSDRMRGYLATDTDLDPLRGEPGFQALLDQPTG